MFINTQNQQQQKIKTISNQSIERSTQKSTEKESRFRSNSINTNNNNIKIRREKNWLRKCKRIRMRLYSCVFCLVRQLFF